MVPTARPPPHPGLVTANHTFPTSNVTGHVSAVQNSQDPGFLAHPQHPLRNTKYIRCLAKQISSSCHSNRSHKFLRVLRNDRRCCNNTNKTATTAKQPTLSNTRNSPGAHGSKGSWCERSSNASDLWPRMVATMGIVSNHAQSQVAGISRSCLT